MTLMAWSAHFETGLKSVDNQHHALVDMINHVAPHLALDNEVAKQAVSPLLDKLTNYALAHFKFEEQLMAQKQVAPAYAAHHHQMHQTFVDEVTQMRQQFERDGGLPGPDLLRFLTSWLSFHILSEDRHMAAQIAAIDSGTTAQQAFEKISNTNNAPHAVYTQSLLDLFTLLTERNRTLILANDAVQKARADLQAANATLELRVQERTRDLAATVARLEQTQNQLLQSEKMAAVGQLAAGVAHEINNPIGFVNSNLGSLSDYVGQLFELITAYEASTTELPQPQRAALDALRQRLEIDYLREDIPSLLQESRDGLARVKRIVGDLRDFSHADDGQWAPADLNHALESALNVAANELKYKARVIKELADLPRVVCNVSQINQVLVNLLVNAAQAIVTTGEITVRTGTQADQVWIEVSDTGCGMTDDMKKRMFEPFYTTKAVGKGTGLGLSITWEIIARHQGHIDVQSSLGKGSTIRITLPIQPIVLPSLS